MIVSVTPAAEPDGRDRNVDWFYRGLDMQAAIDAGADADTAAARRRGRRRPVGGGVGGQLPYWGKYVFHDNNRDINLSQMSMRAITDWYFTAHPPIMHDLHEAQPLMYTYSGGPPQNPNLDPLLFAELPFFSNWELAQMTKWGMPGVYTHAFMDGWSPGYLGSVAYNHNGMMRMYETQSGREQTPAARRSAGAAVAAAALTARRRRRRDAAARRGGGGRGDGGGGRGGRGGGRGGAGPRRRRRAAAGAPAGAPARRRWRRPARSRAASAAVARRCPDRTRRRPAARVVSRHPDSAERRRRRSRAATTPTTWRPACCRRCSSPRCSRTSCSRTST